jgi:hypothetical protein
MMIAKPARNAIPIRVPITIPAIAPPESFEEADLNEDEAAVVEVCDGAPSRDRPSAVLLGSEVVRLGFEDAMEENKAKVVDDDSNDVDDTTDDLEEEIEELDEDVVDEVDECDEEELPRLVLDNDTDGDDDGLGDGIGVDAGKAEMEYDGGFECVADEGGACVAFLEVVAPGPWFAKYTVVT